jgi:pyruvate/2-oxoglutarate dehydrogenase complex dihydrolipoamide acyltransferase (E2) component
VEEIVTAPMDGENVVISFRVQVGDQVNADDVVAEIESDKASVDVVAPTAGTVTKFFVEEHKEMNVGMDTEICAIEAGDVAPAEPEPSHDVRLASKEASGHTEETSESVTPLSRVQLAMVDNMTVKVGDTMTYTINESVDFSSVVNFSKKHGVSPTTSLVKLLADSVHALAMNKKLSSDKRSLRAFAKGADIGMAVEVDGQLRVAVVRDASSKSVEEIGADIESFKAKGSKLAPEDQDLDSVCFVLTSLGKNAPVQAFATLPRGITGILAIGRMQDGRSNFTSTLCHATLTGSEGARLMSEVARRSESL